jgi:hypothetical protein
LGAVAVRALKIFLAVIAPDSLPFFEKVNAELNVESKMLDVYTLLSIDRDVLTTTLFASIAA